MLPTSPVSRWRLEVTVTHVFRIRGSWLASTAILVMARFSLAPSMAWAQSLPEEELEQEGLAGKPAPGEWSVTLGAGLASVPRYPGADTRRVRPVPLFLIRYDDVFFGPYGLGWSALNVGGFHAGPVLGYEGGRRQSDDPRLYGLGDISRSITGGVFATYRFAPFEIAATVRQAITHSGNGLTGLARFDYRAPLIPHKLDLIAGPHIEFSNSEYDRTWFGVSQIQSGQSGLPAYSPGGGVREAGLHASLDYFATQQLILRAFGQVKRFTSTVSDSPIIESRNQSFIGAGFAYHF
jgi:MipA family protein